MYYLITALVTVVSIVISTLVTQSWWWGLMVWLIIWITYIGIQTWCILTIKYRKRKLQVIWITLWVWLLAWVVTWTRLWSRDVHCRQTPDIVQWLVTIDSIWKANESYIITQWDYRWIYTTDDKLQPWQIASMYALTSKLQTCISTYTHWDVWTRKLSRWIWGGDFDYDRWLVMKWVDGYVQGKTIRLKAESEKLKAEHKNLINFTNFKTTIVEQITTLFPNPRSAWRVGWTLIGTKDLITKSDYDLLIGSWLVHLIVVSGGNLALVILIIWGILFRVPLYIRYLLIGVWLIGYVMIVWPDSSVLRALCMAIMTILWIVAGRKWSFGGMLSIATIILLWYNPMMIYDVWLRLSLGAVIGIYLSYHEVSRLTYQRDRKRWIQWLRQVLLVISTSIGAWLGTLPVLIWQFGSANLTSIVANSVTGIIASITTITELIVIGLYSMFPDFVWVQWMIWIVDQLVAVIYQIAQLTVQWWVWIWVSDQWWMMMIVWSIIVLFVLLYHHTQKMRVEYLLEIEDDIWITCINKWV